MVYDDIRALRTIERRDRIRDRVLTGMSDRMTNSGLVMIGLIEVAGAAISSGFRNVRDFSGKYFSRAYIKSLMACSALAFVLFIVLALRLSSMGFYPTADIVRMVRVADDAWSVVTVENSSQAISDDVMAYKDTVQKYAKEYDMEDYIPLIYAVMEQESGGTDPDIMQASTCFYNEEYSQVVGGITDADYSIQCGVQYLKYCMEKAGVTGPYDISRIKLALQGYNYGHNYISWALKRDGGYTKENAEAFEDLMNKSLGWDSYGDSSYVSHVLRYYPSEYQQEDTNN